MSEIIDNDIRDILFRVSKKNILPKYKNLNSSDIQRKNNNDLVTSVDIDVEKILEKKLTNLLPDSLFVGEELFSRNPKILDNYNQKKFCWTVDPIDGTGNFVKGEEKFAIMVALTFKDKVIQSWIYKPLIEEFSYAKLGGGAYINDKRIYNNNELTPVDPTGSISSKYWDEKYLDKIFNIKNKFKHTNSYGCIGFEYIDIAKGVRNFTILSKLFPWDHIPGTLIIQESGGHIKHFDYSSYNYIVGKNNLVVTNSIKLLNEILNLIKE